MLFQIVDNLIIILFVLFLIYIFRGYHLSRREKEFNDDECDE
ncbi:MAG: hypothetical protein PHW18_05680 [Sulfuricurvum sp.]|nr:hypothetical protein [Sulfuricurvum sp.]MDD2829047.1 hypothetical protein [Sulfuricurvum sp.]MDD4949694.1 hypothetical protein [Sulfuricurvum sp.]